MRFSMFNVILSGATFGFVIEYLLGSGIIALYYAGFMCALNMIWYFVNPTPSPRDRPRSYYQRRFEKQFDRDIKTLRKGTRNFNVAALHDYLQSRSWDYTGNFKSGSTTVYHWDSRCPDATFDVFGMFDTYGLRVEKSYKKKGECGCGGSCHE